MTCDADEDKIMTLVLKETEDWKNLKDLTEEDLLEQIEVYLKAYGTKLTELMNKTRSEDQSAVRKRYIEDVQGGMIVSAKKYLGVMQRPDLLLLLDEDTDDQGVNDQNKEVNKNNKRYRERFQHFLTTFLTVGAPSKTWTPELQSSKCLSNYKDKDGVDFIPPEAEAMIILYVENNEKKWVWQAGVLKEHKTIKEWENAKKEKEAKAGKGEKKDDQSEPPTLYSNSSCGATKYGGWSPEGQRRFKKLVKLVQMARAKDTTGAVEEQFQGLIKQQYQDSAGARRAARVEEPEVVVEEEEDDGEVEFEEYDSEEEDNTLKKQKFVTEAEKEAAKKKAAAEAAKAKAAKDEAAKDEAAEEAAALAAAPAPAAAGGGGAGGTRKKERPKRGGNTGGKGN